MPEASPRPPAARPLMPLWMAVLSAAAAGVLLDLTFPSVAAWGLAFPAVALLLLSLIGRRAGGAFLVSLVFGLVFFGLLVSWTSRYLGPIPWAALTILQAVLLAAASVLIALAYRWLPKAFPGRTARLLLLPTVVAALWVARELFLGSWPYGGFPWARLGMTQASSPLAEVASWVGVTGLSFGMVLLVAMLIESVRLRIWRNGPWWMLTPAVLVLALVLAPLYPTTSTGALRIGAVQGNGPTGYFDEREPYAVIEAQLAASRSLIDKDVDLVVWPEGSVEADPYQYPAFARRLTRFANQVDAPVLANAATQRGDQYFNTSMLWLPDGTAEQVHDKRHPVPFGEYVPDRAFYNAIVPDLIGLIQREYTPGENPPIVQVGGTAIGLAICFDVIYDDVIWEGIGEGAEILVFQTNNADFRGTDENLQQLAFARMRAIETGRSVVNVSTVGTSQVIRQDGSTVTTLDADTAGAMLEDVELRSGRTAGVVIGPWVQQMLLWGGLGALLLSWWRARRD